MLAVIFLAGLLAMLLAFFEFGVVEHPSMFLFFAAFFMLCLMALGLEVVEMLIKHALGAI